jgi:hypothetical protein
MTTFWSAFYCMSLIFLCSYSSLGIVRLIRYHVTPLVPDWPWWRNADARLSQLTNGKNTDAGLSFFPNIQELLHLLILCELKYINYVKVFKDKKFKLNLYLQTIFFKFRNAGTVRHLVSPVSERKKPEPTRYRNTRTRHWHRYRCPAMLLFYHYEKHF